eukprot:TRINITY_DN68597_c0_g1_i1.p1 TRINITY_DN68597_c0_g1~~TRINITY_DN68597_c0_g1_i1.p1  ORF type:complete len:513 (+),score=93.49 TRINITY_DN68597_c0_g1_i1:65-1603(+)
MYCEASLLRALDGVCWQVPIAVELLRATCHYCPVGEGDEELPTFRPCREDNGTLHDLAISAVKMGSSLGKFCIPAYFAAYLVILQYSSSNRKVAVPDAIMDMTRMAYPCDKAKDHSFSLAPYPFWSKLRCLDQQVAFHQQFAAAHRLHCFAEGGWGASRDELRSGYIVRAAHQKPEARCLIRITDEQLQERCRKRRSSQRHAGMRGFSVDPSRWKPGEEADSADAAVVGFPSPGPASSLAGPGIECPSDEVRAEWLRLREEAASQDAEKALGQFRVMSSFRKYTQRATGAGDSDLGCESKGAEWKRDLSSHHKCVFVVIMERLQLAPGALVLDWGSGCGHKLSWANVFYGVRGVGLEMVTESVRWAREHSYGHFCEVDGRFLSWLPRGHFDAVISYAALMHLSQAEQCEVVIELVGTVRVGGHLWFGWNAPGIWANDSELEKQWMLPEAWHDCFSKAAKPGGDWATRGVAIAWETEDEALLFPDDSSQQTYLYWRPAYSLFITRVPSGASDW